MSERRAFYAAASALWLLFALQAWWSPILLDDWFQIRYWRDHEFGVSALWSYARHNYYNYNPRIGEVVLAVVDGSHAIHVVATPIVQLALLPLVFAIAFGRWPRPTLRDLYVLLFIQVMIWLVIPIPGVIYFYRPFTTNYLWGFTITLALVVPYRLAGARLGSYWLAPIMLVLGWVAGMCNEHTGPTAMVAVAGFIAIAWHRRQLRSWMIAGMVGLAIGYPMLIYAPGQYVRYGGIANRHTPSSVLGERGVGGCLDILVGFAREAWLGIVLFAAIFAGYVWRRRALPALSRTDRGAAALLVAAAALIVATLFLSPTASDRLFFASAVLLVGALAIVSERMYADRTVRRIAVVACSALAAYHAARFVEAALVVKAENDQRIAAMREAPPGSVPIVASYRDDRSRWSFGDDFKVFPWLRGYVATTLFDLAGVDLDVATPPPTRLTCEPACAVRPPTYREWQATPLVQWMFGATVAPTTPQVAVRLIGLAVADPRRRPIYTLAWSRERTIFVDGRPDDNRHGHFVRVARSTLPRRVDAALVIGCNVTRPAHMIDDGQDVLIPIDERQCRGPFTVLACEPDRCWVAGWY